MSLNWLIVAQFVIGATNSMRCSIGYVYLMELLPDHLKTSYGTMWGIVEGLIFIFGTFYFWQLTKDMTILLTIGLNMQIISLVLTRFLPESPVFLIQKGRLLEAKESLQKIADMNSC
jgi:MFS family permease